MASEPAFKTNIIHTLNTECAKSKSGLVLRLRQPTPVCHCQYSTFTWTDTDAKTFLEDRTKLPRDLTTIEDTGTCLCLWIFDASGTGGLLPALELDPKPLLDEFPALCIFDMSGDAVPENQRKVALIPSEYLRMVDVVGNKVQFVLREGRDASSFTTTQASLGAQLGGM